jgi:hypothetical protein
MTTIVVVGTTRDMRDKAQIPHELRPEFASRVRKSRDKSPGHILTQKHGLSRLSRQVPTEIE